MAARFDSRVFTSAVPIMMLKFKLLPVLALTLLAQSAVVFAQNVSAVPPKLEPIDNVDDTPITVTAKTAPKNTIEEHREQGRVTEAKVTSGPSTYYLRPNQDPQANDIPGRNLSGPQWKVMEFNLGSKKKTTHEPVEVDNTPAPPTTN